MLNPPSPSPLRLGTTFVPAQAVMVHANSAPDRPILNLDELEAAASIGLGTFIDVYA